MRPGHEEVVRQLRWHQRLTVRLVALVVGIWTSTIRFTLDEETRRLVETPDLEPAVVVLWHNRLFLAPAFYRRYFPSRSLAVLVSASGDGAWLAFLIERVGMRVVRGSRNKRGLQALRELVRASRAGLDIGVTPDGSLGPVYDMKAGAVAVALRSGAPLVLLSFNFGHAWRLRNWDRFFLPKPFSTVEAKLDWVGGADVLGDEVEGAVKLLKARLDAITVDHELGDEGSAARLRAARR